MQLSVPLTDKGLMPDKYSKHSEIQKAGQPVVSFPITISDVPDKAKYLAVSLIDYDAVPVSGSPFIHWLAANLPVQSIEEDFSRSFDGPQGMNSWYSRLDDPYVTSHYAGPNPPDKTHRYTLIVYALDHEMNLKDKFFYNEFLDELKDNILDQGELVINSRA